MSNNFIKNILLITGNSNKVKEFKFLQEHLKLNIETMSLDLQEIQSMDLIEIGQYKTKQALKKINLDQKKQYDAVLTDDVGLFCDGLNGFPGPFIKWFLKKFSINELANLIIQKNIKAQAECILSIGIIDTLEIYHFHGSQKGNIVMPRGDNNFGWDPIFQPTGFSDTYAEMSSVQKNQISHRSIAIQKLHNWIYQIND